MKLQVSERSVEKKREAKRVRRAGKIPAIVYLHDGKSANIAVDSVDFNTALRNVTPGRLSTTVFVLTDEKGKEKRALVKDIQYVPTTYEVSHLDFEELVKDQQINVRVPIECTGVMECVGVKLGGVIRQVIRYLPVRTDSHHIPTHFDVDVKELNLGQYKKLADLSIPANMRPLVDLNEVAVVIVRR